MMTSYAMEQYRREYTDARLAEAAQERLLATVPGATKGGRGMVTIAIRYTRYALSALASTGMPLGLQ
jgi:hypothetical protein